jgi:hypothetical protein
LREHLERQCQLSAKVAFCTESEFGRLIWGLMIVLPSLIGQFHRNSRLSSLPAIAKIASTTTIISNTRANIRAEL